MDAWVVILAAGSGERLGSDQPKAFVVLAGRPMLAWSLEAASSSPAIKGAVLVVPPDLVHQARAMVADASIDTTVVEGGPTRQASVRMGLSAVPPSADVVVCHDAARPLAPPELFDGVIDALGVTAADGVVPVVSSPDTVKRVSDGRVMETIPRGEVGLAQTPQAFTAAVLREAHRRALRDGLEGTDDAILLEKQGHRVAAIEGVPANLKITTPEDVDRAERILAGRPATRAGGSGG